MAHIATCMIEASLDKSAHAGSSLLQTAPTRSHTLAHSASESSLSLASTNSSSTTSSPATTEAKPHVWRMQQHHEARKYQLFPKDRQQPSAIVTKPVEVGQAKLVDMSSQSTDSKLDKDKASTASGLRVRIKEHTLNRRRKVSIPDLGPMTTVQEVSMDSPTIPGRPAIHERSISAPDSVPRGHHRGDLYLRAHDVLDKKELSPVCENYHQRSVSEAPRHPMSPKALAPLIIPPALQNVQQAPKHERSLSRLRAAALPLELPPKPTRYDDSLRSRSPYTPMTGSTTLSTPRSASTSVHSASTLPTPVSACMPDSRLPSATWTPGQLATPPVPRGSDNDSPRTEDESYKKHMAHRRGASESGSIIERGRPRKRVDEERAAGPKRAESKDMRSVERKTFEELPTGYKASEAAGHMSPSELAALQKQAFGQASRFEVLRKDQVDALSKASQSRPGTKARLPSGVRRLTKEQELRQLDERAEYLRRTYSSLRAGRRNLHARMGQYLRSLRVAKFSTEAMVKQEDALAELDASIDDWVGKLEQAENRRARVRQKLLEHIAAAAILPVTAALAVNEPVPQATEHQAPLATGRGDISTPPRSPTRHASLRDETSSPSPQRVVPHVPSTILEKPVVAEALSTAGKAATEAATAQRRADLQSIRIYADSNVYALFADVENEITKMSAACRDAVAVASPISDKERKKIHRTQSHEVLSQSSAEAKSFLTPPGPSDASQGVFLTSAVFKP